MIDWNDVSTWQILIVDDEPDNLEVVAETLEFQGAQVKTALNGKAGLEALEDFDANLILTDLSMPVMNGWELRTRVKNDSKWSSIPVMALSAHVIAGDKERALQTGFEGYLTKPINIRTLLDDIRAAYVKPANHANQTSPTDHVNQTSPTNHANQTSPTNHANQTVPRSTRIIQIIRRRVRHHDNRKLECVGC